MRAATHLLGIALLVSSAAAVDLKREPGGLIHIKRVYVDQLGGGRESDQMRDMLIAALQNTRLFTITEDSEHADAALRGSTDDKVYIEKHDTSDSIGIRANASGSSSSKASLGNAVASRGSSGIGITQNEASRIDERHHEASASVRLVDNDGDVLWSTIQESTGGKFRGPMADIADRIARRLVEDIHKAKAEAALTPASK